MQINVKLNTKICLAFIMIIIFLFSFSSCSNKEILKSIYPLEYENLVFENHNKYDVDESLILAVIKAESDFNPNAVSSANAYGLMQITAPTFEWLQYKKNINHKMDESYLFIPSVNIEYGTYFLSILLKRYDDVSVAVSAYNAGISAVDDWLDNDDYSSDGKTLDNIPYSQTDKYVDKVINAQKIYKQLYNID